MGYRIIRNKDKATSYVSEIVADSVDDIPNLPTNASHGLDPGSTCFVIASTDIYMLNNADEWKKLDLE